jgi:hypothetical protein
MKVSADFFGVCKTFWENVDGLRLRKFNYNRELVFVLLDSFAKNGRDFHEKT